MSEERLKAIETVYHGYKFRSRLEARWAVFFDALAVPYEYEREGFDLDGRWYLPDFWLPAGLTYRTDGATASGGAWVEIKPLLADESYPDAEATDAKCARLAVMSDAPVLLLVGQPYVPPGDAWNYVGLLWLPDIERDPELAGPSEVEWQQCRVCLTLWIGPQSNANQGRYVCPRCATEPPSAAVLRLAGVESGPAPGCFCDVLGTGPRLTPLLQAAYTRARQARFEHGHHGD